MPEVRGPSNFTSWVEQACRVIAPLVVVPLETTQLVGVIRGLLTGVLWATVVIFRKKITDQSLSLNL